MMIEFLYKHGYFLWLKAKRVQFLRKTATEDQISAVLQSVLPVGYFLSILHRFQDGNCLVLLIQTAEGEKIVKFASTPKLAYRMKVESDLWTGLGKDDFNVFQQIAPVCRYFEQHTPFALYDKVEGVSLQGDWGQHGWGEVAPLDAVCQIAKVIGKLHALRDFSWWTRLSLRRLSWYVIYKHKKVLLQYASLFTDDDKGVFEKIAHQIFSIFNDPHMCGFCHRDLSSANFLRTADGYRLIDFGNGAYYPVVWDFYILVTPRTFEAVYTAYSHANPHVDKRSMLYGVFAHQCYAFTRQTLEGTNRRERLAEWVAVIKEFERG